MRLKVRGVLRLFLNNSLSPDHRFVMNIVNPKQKLVADNLSVTKKVFENIHKIKKGREI